MPKVTLHFDLPDERYEYDLACQAQNFRDVAYEFTMWVRNERKHGNRANISFDDLWEKWWDINKEFNVDPYMGD